MPEIRVVVTDQLNNLLNDAMEVGLFASKADLVRASIIYFFKDLGWLEKPNKNEKPK